MTQLDGQEPPTSTPGMPPGVCLPFEEKLAEIGDAKGNLEIVREEWERLEKSVYLYLWSWIA